MAADGISPALAIRSSVCVELWHSQNASGEYVQNEKFSRDESKFCRTIEFSPDGRYLAWANGTKVQIASVNDWKVVCSLPRPKAFAVKFSPKGNYLVTLEHITSPKDDNEPAPNLYVYAIPNGEQSYAVITKKSSDELQAGWSYDESLFGLLVGGEALFFEPKSEDGFTKPARRIGGFRGGDLAVAGSGNNPHVSLYVPGVKGAPSMCKIHRYPALDANQVVSTKSFFQADRVEMMWNQRASGMLLMTIMDVDSTGASYYGKQSLHYLNTKGDACAVSLSKDGPIHAVKWSPKGNEFCIIYGYMPSKATFFNLKCDPVFEVKEAPRNSIYYNPFGNIVLLAGFGNLRGNVEVWNNNEKKLITTLQAPDSTMLEWSPSGETFVTATTAPRLRIANGFKVWHYSGALLHETLWPVGQELYDVRWQTMADNVCTEQPISNVEVQGIQPAAPQASKAVYVPPGARGLALSSSAASLGGGVNERSPIPGLPVGYRTSQSDRKKARKGKKDNSNGNATTLNESGGKTRPPKVTQMNQQQNKINNNATNSGSAENGSTVVSQQQMGDQSERPKRQRNRINKNKDGLATNQSQKTGDPEKDKRIRAVAQKLNDIAKLKARKLRGENLEANQLSKIGLESELVKELNDLRIAA